MSSRNRREYLTATTLDQGVLDRAQNNLDNGLHMITDVDAPDGSVIHASDRNKYVDGTFYEALLQFPIIKRSLGEWLAPDIEFSVIQLALSNVDGRFNKYLPGGANNNGWIGKTINVLLGLRDVLSTYTTIFSGVVTDIGGVQRDRKQITLIARDELDKVNTQFPNVVFTDGNFPDIDDHIVGQIIPVIYGDWTVSLISGKLNPSDPASATVALPQVPAFPVNGQDAGVLAGTTALDLRISVNDNTLFDDTEVYLKRGETYHLIDAADITNIAAGKNSFSIVQGAGGGLTLVDGVGYQYASGDTFFVKVKGVDLGSYSDNIVEQARHILQTYGGVTSGQFDANWNTFRAKASPSESAVVNIKSRVWIQEPQSVIQYALSMLEQVRLEAFVSREQKFKINSLHLDNFVASPTFTVRNWDIEEGSFRPVLDDRNVWNRARASYAFNPATKDNSFETPIYKNTLAVTAAGGKEISKRVVFPNLYEKAAVVNQLKEMLKLASAYSEYIELTLTPRAMLRELGDFVSVNVNMGSTILENVPAMIRELSYDPRGMKIPARLWSMQMVEYPGYTPGYVGMTGGSAATIIEE